MDKQSSGMPERIGQLMGLIVSVLVTMLLAGPMVDYFTR